MKEHFQKILEDKRFHYFCIFLLSLLIAIPLLNLKIRYTHDGVLHILRLIGTKLSIHNTDFPHLIIPFFCDNFGYSINAFYAPMATYVPYLFTSLPILYSEALKIFSYLTILLSGITMYHCAYEITKKRKVALLASCLYMLAPYRAEDIYTRFALAEFTTFVFVPIIFQGLHNLLEGDRKKHWYIAIGATALVLTHTITTFYVAIFCLAYVLLHWSRNKERQKETLKKILWNTFFILGMTAFFWVVLLEFRAFTEYTFFDKEYMRTNGEFVQEQAIELKDFWRDNPSNPEDALSFRLGIFTILALGSGIIVFRKQRKDKTYVIFTVFALMSLFLCTKIFPWKEMPEIFWQIQYPWRMLGEFVFFSSIVIAKNCECVWDMLRKKKAGQIIFVLVCFLLLAGQFATGITHYTKMQEKQIESDKTYEDWISQNVKFSIYVINRDYLPVSAIMHKDEIDTKEDVVSIIEGDAQITEEVKNGANLYCSLTNVKKGSKLEIPFFYYPGYVVTLKNGQEEQSLSQQESKYGMITVEIPQDIEKAGLTVTYQGTILEKISYFVSIFMYFLFIAMIIYERRKEKNEEKSHEE